MPFDVQSGRVVEFGMGVAGLYSHLQNVKDGRYAVTGIHASKPEVQALKGIAEVNGVNDPGKMNITDAGIAKSIDMMLEETAEPDADIVIASRVHAAGNHLKANLGRVSKILRPGGLFVGRGPRYYKQGITYNQVAAIMHRDPRMRTIIDKTYAIRLPNGASEPNRIYIAAKK